MGGACTSSYFMSKVVLIFFSEIALIFKNALNSRSIKFCLLLLHKLTDKETNTEGGKM